MSPRAHTPVKMPLGFPRVSGDEPMWIPEEWDAALFSPRERG